MAQNAAMTPKCHNCENPAMYRVGPEGNEFALCLDCTLKHRQLSAIESDQLEREMNFAVDEMEAIMGRPGALPRYPLRQTPIVQTGPVTFVNFKISDSVIGVLNTGNLQMADTAINTLKGISQTKDFANGISRLITAITDSDLPKEKKDEAIETLTAIAVEATAPADKRKKSVLKTLYASLPTVIQTAKTAIEVYKIVEPMVRHLIQ